MEVTNDFEVKKGSKGNYNSKHFFFIFMLYRKLQEVCCVVAILTATAELIEKILHLLPLSGVLSMWGIKWNKCSVRRKKKKTSPLDILLCFFHNLRILSNPSDSWNPLREPQKNVLPRKYAVDVGSVVMYFHSFFFKPFCANCVILGCKMWKHLTEFQNKDWVCKSYR